MEPMNLGSPPSSPASPNPNYLPAFLMGDSQPTSPNPATSPGRNKTPMMKVQGSYTNSPNNFRHKLFNPMGDYAGQSPYASPAVERGGPPKLGLFDTIESAAKSPMVNSTMNFNEPQVFANESFSRIGNESLNYSCNMNESKIGYQAYSRNDRGDTLWVTIFGFQSNSAGQVLHHLQNCGTILEKKFPTQGNWLHLKFSAPHEVSKALSLNGKLISNCIMIGVVPYYVKSENKENSNNSTILTSPLRARPLRNSIIVPQSPGNIVSPNNVPQKSTGIVTKAMEYVFGW